MKNVWETIHAFGGAFKRVLPPKFTALAKAAITVLVVFPKPALAELKLIREWIAAPALIQNVEFSPDGKQLLTASGGGVAQLWGLDGTPGRVMQGQRPPMFNSHFNRKGSQFLTTGYDGSVWLWDRNGTLLQKFFIHKAAVSDARFLGDNGNFVSGSDDGTVVLRNPKGQPMWIGIYPGTTRQLAATSEGNLVVAASDNGQLHIIVRDQTGKIAKVKSFQTPHGRMNQLSISADGKKIAASGIDGTVTIWDLQGKMLGRLKATTKGWADGGVFCNTERDLLLTAGDDGVVREWSQAGKYLGELKLSTTSRLTKLDCAPNGRMAAAVGSSGELWLIEVTPLHSHP